MVKQFIDGLPPALKISLSEKKITSGPEAGLAADTYVGVRRYRGQGRGLPGDVYSEA